MDKRGVIHIIKTLVFCNGIASVICSVLIIMFMMFSGEYIAVTAVVYILMAIVAGRLASKGLPSALTARYLPAVIPAAVTLVTWTVCYALSGGSFAVMNNSGAFSVYSVSQITHFAVIFMAGLSGQYWFVFWLPLCFNLMFLVSFAVFERTSKEHTPGPAKSMIDVKAHRFIVITAALFVVSGLTVGITYMYRSATVLPADYGRKYGGGYSSVDLYNYDISNPDNVLPVPDGGSSFTIEAIGEMPVLDGAEAAFPVYSAFANVCYMNLKSEIATGEKYLRAGEKVTFTNTIYAFERLISGEIDIFFGAEPSAAQYAIAKKAGCALILTPIGKEAFVFFVSRDNTVENLTVEQIKSIYSGGVTNWSTLGGGDAKIFAFQRPENSGSQTILQKIMGGTHIMTPLKEEYASGMGDITEKVADFRSYPGSIGFSFRFYLTGMTANAGDVRMIAIDGVAPDTETIASGVYPFTVNLYAITLKSNKLKTIEPFLDWMISDQGQTLVEATGYVRNT